MERCQRLDDVAPTGGGRDLTAEVYSEDDGIRSESMLDAYVLLRLISPQQHETGMRYGAICKPESQRIMREINAALTPSQLKIVQRVCRDNKMAGGAEAMETLRCGLDRLVGLRNIR